MTVLVTGASGFLGSHVAEQLARQGRAVRALVRRTSDVRFLESLGSVELVEGAVDDARSFEQAARGVEAIVHSAGLVKARSPREFLDVNAGGTANAVHAARRAGSGVRRLVLVSSQAALGPSLDGQPLPEDTAPSPVTHYGRSKLEAERIVLEAQRELPVTIVRPPAIYGPRDREILAIFQAVSARVLPYFGSTEKRLNLIYGADAAAACIAAIDADSPSGSIYAVDDGEVHRFADLVEAVEAAVGRRALLRVPLPRAVMLAAATGSELWGRMRSRAVMLTRDKLNELLAPHWVSEGSARARRELGWQPSVAFAEGVRLTAEWYRKAGWI